MKDKYFIYVIQSLSHGTRYVGVTTDVVKRLSEHNAGKCRYTKGRRPWKVLHREGLGMLSEARKREIFLKSGQGRKFLDSILC
jgi:putative endonuclease